MLLADTEDSWVDMVFSIKEAINFMFKKELKIVCPIFYFLMYYYFLISKNLCNFKIIYGPECTEKNRKTNKVNYREASLPIIFISSKENNIAFLTLKVIYLVENEREIE